MPLGYLTAPALAGPCPVTAQETVVAQIGYAELANVPVGLSGGRSGLPAAETSDCPSCQVVLLWAFPQHEPRGHPAASR
jgi:hypothetical protein